MPSEFVERWPKLRALGMQLLGLRYIDELSAELKSSDAVLSAVVEDAREKTGQRFCGSPKARRAIEKLSLEKAKSYYKGLGYSVEELGKPYDLRCSRDGRILHVEVKGTTTEGTEIILTPNEVAFANEHASSMALFVVSGICVSENDEPVATGGKAFELRPWSVDQSRLSALCYSYSVPPRVEIESRPLVLEISEDKTRAG